MIKSNKITIKINKKELSDDYLPELSKAKSKTPVRGGGALRPRWKDNKGDMYELHYKFFFDRYQVER